MIACASPADTNMDESLSTVKYASRARNIKNKPIVNRDANSMLIEALRKQVLKLQNENSQLSKLLKDGGIVIPELKEIKQEQVKHPQPMLNQPVSMSPALSTHEIRDLKLKLSKL